MLRGNISIIFRFPDPLLGNLTIKGLYGPEHHIVEVNGDVADAGKNKKKQGRIVLLFTIVEGLLQPRK